MTGVRPGELHWLVRGGGEERHTQEEGAVGKNSSYRSELWGVVCTLRWLSGWIHTPTTTRGKRRAGDITHWTDNEGVVIGLARLDAGALAGNKSYRELSCDDLWAEVNGRLEEWKDRGGTWTSYWVKGHVHATNRAQDTYTLAEKMNIEADQLAGTHLSASVADLNDICNSASLRKPKAD
jgi:hypothetical protein